MKQSTNVAVFVLFLTGIKLQQETMASPVIPTISPSSPSGSSNGVNKELVGLKLEDQTFVVVNKLLPRTNSAEKLKRGLTNFMNQLNPAPFFVPSSPSHQILNQFEAKVSTKASSGSFVAEPAAIISSEPTADVIIKQTRPIGGPMRWGR